MLVESFIADCSQSRSKLVQKTSKFATSYPYVQATAISRENFNELVTLFSLPLNKLTGEYKHVLAFHTWQ
jgi:hypothetical protein